MSDLRQYIKRPLLIAILFVLASTALNLLFHQTPWEAEIDGYFYFIDDGPLLGREYGWSWLHPPLFLVVGKAFNIIIGDGFRAGQMASAVSAGFLIFLGGLLAGLLSEKREAATTAALLSALSDGVLNQSMLCTTDMLFSTLSLAGFVGLFLTWSRLKPRYAALTGILFGLAYMTRYQGNVFLLAAPLSFLIVKESIRFRLSMVFYFLLGAAIAIVPLVSYEHFVLGIPLKAASGLYIYQVQPDIVSHAESVSGFFARLKTFVSNTYYIYPYAMFYLLRLCAVLPLITAVAGVLWMWRSKKFSGVQLRSVILFGLVGLLYFIEVGWMMPQSLTYQSHWRFLLPILPLVFVVAAFCIESVDSRWTRYAIKAACIAPLIYFNLSTNIFALRFEPPPQKLFSERLKSEVETEHLSMVGNPIDFYLYFRQFAFLEVEQCLDANGILSLPQDKNSVKYDLLILPEYLVKEIQAQPDDGRWFTDVHELLFCSDGYCAFKPKLNQ